MTTDLRQLIAPGQERVRCSNCGDVEPVISQSGGHIRADCPVCGQYIKFLRRSDADLLGAIRKIAPRLSKQQREEAVRVLRGESDV